MSADLDYLGGDSDTAAVLRMADDELNSSASWRTEMEMGLPPSHGQASPQKPSLSPMAVPPLSRKKKLVKKRRPKKTSPRNKVSPTGKGPAHKDAVAGKRAGAGNGGVSMKAYRLPTPRSSSPAANLAKTKRQPQAERRQARRPHEAMRTDDTAIKIPLHSGKTSTSNKTATGSSLAGLVPFRRQSITRETAASMRSKAARAEPALAARPPAAREKPKVGSRVKKVRKNSRLLQPTEAYISAKAAGQDERRRNALRRQSEEWTRDSFLTSVQLERYQAENETAGDPEPMVLYRSLSTRRVSQTAMSECGSMTSEESSLFGGSERGASAGGRLRGRRKSTLMDATLSSKIKVRYRFRNQTESDPRMRELLKKHEVGYAPYPDDDPFSTSPPIRQHSRLLGKTATQAIREAATEDEFGAATFAALASPRQRPGILGDQYTGGRADTTSVNQQHTANLEDSSIAYGAPAASRASPINARNYSTLTVPGKRTTQKLPTTTTKKKKSRKQKKRKEAVSIVAQAWSRTPRPVPLPTAGGKGIDIISEPAGARRDFPPQLAHEIAAPPLWEASAAIDLSRTGPLIPARYVGGRGKPSAAIARVGTRSQRESDCVSAGHKEAMPRNTGVTAPAIVADEALSSPATCRSGGGKDTGQTAGIDALIRRVNEFVKHGKYIEHVAPKKKKEKKQESKSKGGRRSYYG